LLTCVFQNTRITAFSESLIPKQLQVKQWQRRSEWQKKRASCLVATSAATSSTTASAYVHTAAEVLAAIAAQATARQQADKTAFFAHSYSVVKKKW